MAASLISGGMEEVRLEQGVIRYRDAGSGAALVFVHGILVNAVLWRDVVARLSGKFRCIVPDLPLGGHSVPLRSDADLSPKGVARIVADLIEALDLEDVTLVGNDTGGAICQIVIAGNPERISRLVLTNCDAYEAFFPPALSPIHYAARFFGTGFVDVLARMLRTRPARRVLFWTVSKRRPDTDTLDAYIEPLISSAGVRRDLTRFLQTVSRRGARAGRRVPRLRSRRPAPVTGRTHPELRAAAGKCRGVKQRSRPGRMLLSNSGCQLETDCNKLAGRV